MQSPIGEEPESSLELREVSFPGVPKALVCDVGNWETKDCGPGGETPSNF